MRKKLRKEDIEKSRLADSVDLGTGFIGGAIAAAFRKRKSVISAISSTSSALGVGTSALRFSRKDTSAGQDLGQDFLASVAKSGAGLLGAATGLGATVLAGKGLGVFKAARAAKAAKNAKKAKGVFTKSKPKAGFRDVTKKPAQITFIRKNGRVIPVRKK